MKGFLKNTTIMFALCSAFFVLSITAQEPVGAIEGTVRDPQSAIVQGAEVTLRNISTNATRTVQSNDDGRFNFTQVRPDIYELRVAATGFKQTLVSNVVVEVGRTTPADVTLEIGVGTETVTVTGGGEAQVDRTDNAVSGVVSPRQIQNLPLNGRNFLDLAQLQPGVEKIDGGNFDPTKANYTGVSIAGQAGRSAQIAVDGGSVVDNVVGTTVQNFSQEIVQEFQLGISNFDISTGASSTGSVNVITKSGTNNFRGNVFSYFRDDKFAAFPSLIRLVEGEGIPPAARTNVIPFDRQQFGGTIGGPIVKDKAFFFFSYERNNQDGASLFTPLQAPSFSGFTLNPFDETLLTGKVDWNINTNNRFSGRYSFNDNLQQTPFPVGAGIVPRDSASGIFQSNDQIVFNRSHGFVANWSSILTPSVTNNFVYNFSDFENRIDPAVEDVPEIRLLPGQIWRSGTNAITPQATLQRRNQFRDDVTWIKGDHTFRFGGNYERTSVGGLFQFAKPGRIRLFGPGSAGVPQTEFSTEADFLNAFVRDISFGVGDPNLPFNSPDGNTINHRLSVYGGDSWKINSNFSFNYALSYRIDSNLWNHDQSRPAVVAPLFGKGTAPSPKDTNNFAPRVGFAWDVGGNGKTIIRGGFGMYYDNTIDNLRLFERADLGPAGAELFLVGTAVQAPVTLAGLGGDGQFTLGQVTLAQMLALLPQVRAEVEANSFNCTLPTSIECFGAVSGPLFSTEFQVPYSLQYSIGLQRELPWNMLLQADFNYRKGVHEVIVYDINRHDDVVNGPVLPTSALNSVVPYADSSGFSTYQAMLLRVDRRFSNGFQFTGSYTLSRFKAFGGDTLGLGAAPTDLLNLRADFGPAGLDRTQRFVFSAIYELPWYKNSSSQWKKQLLGGYTVSMISTAFSGLPQSVFLPGFADLTGTGTFASYLPGTGPGSIGRSIKTVDELNALIRQYNSTIAGGFDPQGTPLVALAELPADTQIGTDSVISQDIRLTKAFRFNENVKLDLIGEVFNLFNIANLTNVGNFTLAPQGTPADQITTLRPTQRATSVFGTGGPRAFQFGLRFTF